MRNLEFGMRAFAGFAVFAFFVGSAATAQTPATGNAQQGKDLYLKYSCYACHGYDGHGGAGARLVPLRLSLPAVPAHLHKPRQKPPFTAQGPSDAPLADIWAPNKSLSKSPPAEEHPPPTPTL